MTLPDVGFIVRGHAGAYPGSAQVRVIRRLIREVHRETITARQLDVELLLSGFEVPASAVLVQRDALGPIDGQAFLEVIRSWGARLVVEVDDDFFSESAIERLSAAEYDPRSLRTLRAVVAASDATIVSTHVLKDLLKPIGNRIEVIPNAIDPDIWSSRRIRSLRPQNARVLYMGSTTHREDLEILRPVFDRLVARNGRAIELDVVGVTDTDSSWFRRIEIPPGHHHYPDFASWLSSRRSSWAVGVAPLSEASFNRSKSDIKFLEYSAMSLATVASESAAYAGIARHGGRLIPFNSTGEWRDAIKELVDHPIKRIRSAALARRYVWEKRVLTNDDGWLQVVLGER